MPKKRKKYKRLPGRSRAYVSFFDPNRYKLWLGEDHLLHLSSTHFSETYKRFYFKDIQALVITRTTRGKWSNVVLGALIVLFTLLGLAGIYLWGWPPDAALPVFIIVTALLALALAVNTLFGPTCRCRLNTAVQFEDLPSLGRLRTARRTLAILATAIEAVQGKLDAEELEASSEEQEILQVSEHALSQTTTSHDGETGQLKHEDGKAHTVLFGLMFPLAASALIDIFFQHPTKNLFDTLFFLVILLLVIVSLVRQRGSDLPLRLKTTTWALLVSLIGIYMSGIILGIVDMMTNLESNPPPTPFDPASPFDILHEGPIFTAFYSIQAIVYIVFGLVGAVQMFKIRSTRANSQIADPSGAVPDDTSADDTSVESERNDGE